MNFLSLLTLFFISTSSVYSIRYRIINTPVLWNIECINFHHIVIVSNKDKDLYAVDFTPVKHTTPRTKVKLLFFMSVPGEVRIRHIKGVDFTDDTSIIESWKKDTNMDYNKVYREIRDKEIKGIMKRALEWPDHMNMYTHNCQHFSRFVMSVLTDGL
jgi:hypothetical protein